MVSVQYLVMAIAALMPQVIAQTCATINPSAQPTFAPGYSGRVVMNGLRSPRSVIFDQLGNALVVEQGGGGIRWIKLTDNGGTNVCVGQQKQLIADSSFNHGLDISADGKTIFVSNNGNVFSYAYDAAAGTATAKKTLVTGMGNTGTHLTRSVVTSKKVPDYLMVQRGSSQNIDTTTVNADSGRSQIRLFNISAVSQTAASYTSGQVLAWGLRNSVGFGEHPVTSGIFSVDNGLDDMKKGGKDIHQSNPCEELNFHGVLNAAAPERGQNFGYPNCHAAWDPSVIPNNQGISVGTPIVMDSPPTSGTTDATCQQRGAPKLCFPSHTAPLDIKINANGTVAYIAFHGSWNRQPADGFRLSKINMNPTTGLPSEASNSNRAETPVMYNANTGSCPSGCFRPTGLAWDPKGRLFMTSDSTGELWIVGGAA